MSELLRSLRREAERRNRSRMNLLSKRRRFQRRQKGGGQFHGGGWPDATTTGPAAGTVFSAFSGQLTTTSDGQVIEKLQCSEGFISLRHNNVTIRDCIVGGTAFFAIDNIGLTLTGCLIERCRIIGGGGQAGLSLGPVANAEIRFCDISHFTNGMFVDGSGWNIHDNYIHDLTSTDVDPHIDCIQGSGSNPVLTGLTIQHNTLVSWDTSCIILQTESGGWDGITINNNLMLADPLHGGIAHGILCQRRDGDPVTPGITNVTITNNRIQTTNVQFPIFAHKLTPPVTITGNVSNETGAPISNSG